MITADTSTWVAYFEGSDGDDTRLLDAAIVDRHVVMAPIVLTELLSDPKLPSSVAQTLCEVPLLETAPGYWHRAGSLRAKVLSSRRKARLGDALIAQSCVDHGIRLITRDRDFGNFAALAGLLLR